MSGRQTTMRLAALAGVLTIFVAALALLAMAGCHRNSAGNPKVEPIMPCETDPNRAAATAAPVTQGTPVAAAKAAKSPLRSVVELPVAERVPDTATTPQPVNIPAPTAAPPSPSPAPPAAAMPSPATPAPAVDARQMVSQAEVAGRGPEFSLGKPKVGSGAMQSGRPAEPAALAASSQPPASTAVSTAASTSASTAALTSTSAVHPDEQLPPVNLPLPASPTAAPATSAVPGASTASAAPATPAAPLNPAANLRVINAAVAEVNGEVITREDLMKPLRHEIGKWPTSLSQQEIETRIRTALREKLQTEVSRRLLLQEARKKVPAESIERIDKEVAKERQRQIAEIGGVTEWQKRLATVGETPDTWSEIERDRFLIQAFILSEIDPRLSVTRPELLAHYESVRPQRYEQAAQAHLLLIKLRPQDFPDQERLLALARTLIGRARQGEDFGKLAQRFSKDPTAAKGGDWGTLQKGSFVEEAVDNALFTLPVGGVSEPLICREGVYIVKVASRTEARTVPFTEAQAQVEAAVRQEKRHKMLSDYVADLYRKGHVEVHEENL